MDVLQTGSQVVPVVHRWEIIILITKMRDSHKKSPAASSVALVARGRADAANLGEPESECVLPRQAVCPCATSVFRMQRASAQSRRRLRS